MVNNKKEIYMNPFVQEIVNTFLPTLNTMALLFLFIALGYLLAKLKLVPDGTAGILAKLENFVLLPASVLSSFIRNFTLDNIGNYLAFFIGGIVAILISIPIAILIARLGTKDSYLRKIYTYGLSFPNFGFMGYAVVLGVNPAIYTSYLVFVIPFWALIYVWGVPSLLIPSDDGKKTVKSRLKAFLNPMFIAMVVGMILGIVLGLLGKTPSKDSTLFIISAMDQLGACMSPVAMLLTGMTIAKIDLKKTFTKTSLYIISLFRLIVIPLAFIAALIFIPSSFVSPELKFCIICAASMPLGLNTIVIPSAYGLDTTEASGMALISHLLSCLSIPIVFALFNLLVSA